MTYRTYLKHVSRAAAAGALALASGCDLFGLADGCTVAGCITGLTVSLQGQPTSAYRIEVRVPGAQTAYVYDCPDPTRCAGVATFADFTPGAATVTVTTDRGTVRQDVRPTYQTTRPNGEDCEPVCRHATVEVPLPT